MKTQQKRHILKYIFICMFFMQHLHAQTDITLESIIEQIRSINEKFIILEKKDLDINVTNTNENFNNIDLKKEQLIVQVPPLITRGDYVPIIQKDFDLKIDNIVKKIQKFKSKSDFINSTKYSIKLSTLQADNIFYKTVDKIRNLSLKSINKRILKEPIEESLLSLKTLTLPELSTEKFTLEEDQLHMDELKNEKIKAKSIIQTYTQILNYLYENIYLFSDVGIGYAIDYTNEILPFETRFFNTGKILLSLLAIGIFTGIFFLLKRRKFFIFIYTPSRKQYPKEIKKAIIRATNRPLYALTILYCIDLCTSIYHYPYALPEYVKTIISGSYIITVAWIFIGIVGGYGIALINSVVQNKNHSFRKEVANILLKVIYFFIGSIAFLLVLSNFGVNVSAIVASLGIGGLAVALAAKDILANFFASIMLLFDNAFSQGDWIQTGSIEGTVVEIGLRRTTIRTFENALLFVPNSNLSDSPITNWSRRKVGRRIKMNIGLTYNSPKDKIEKCIQEIREMLLSHSGIADPNDTSLQTNDYRFYFKENIVSIQDLKGYKRTLLVYLDNFSSSSIDILVYCFSQTTNWDEWLQVKEDVMFKIIDIVEKNELSFAFPSQSLYIESLPQETIGKMLEKRITNENNIVEH